MISLNEVTILGRAGCKPTLYNCAFDRKYCQVTVYINTKARDNSEEDSTKVNCEAWGDLAVIIDRLSISQGQEMLIKGKLRNRKSQKASDGKELCVVIHDLRIFPLKQRFKAEGTTDGQG